MNYSIMALVGCAERKYRQSLIGVQVATLDIIPTIRFLQGPMSFKIGPVFAGNIIGYFGNSYHGSGSLDTGLHLGVNIEFELRKRNLSGWALGYTIRSRGYGYGNVDSGVNTHNLSLALVVFPFAQ